MVTKQYQFGIFPNVHKCSPLFRSLCSWFASLNRIYCASCNEFRLDFLTCINYTTSRDLISLSFAGMVQKINAELPINNLNPCKPIVFQIPIAEEFLGLNFSEYQPVCRHRDEVCGHAVHCGTTSSLRTVPVFTMSLREEYEHINILNWWRSLFCAASSFMHWARLSDADLAQPTSASALNFVVVCRCASRRNWWD